VQADHAHAAVDGKALRATNPRDPSGSSTQLL
jgi:hypothetical protein